MSFYFNSLVVVFQHVVCIFKKWNAAARFFSIIIPQYGIRFHETAVSACGGLASGDLPGYTGNSTRWERSIDQVWHLARSAT
jgi:hypothetical protein